MIHIPFSRLGMPTELNKFLLCLDFRFWILDFRFRGLCIHAAMDRWHDLKLPTRAYLNFVPETLWMD